jgi:hypothetical protein
VSSSSVEGGTPRSLGKLSSKVEGGGTPGSGSSKPPRVPVTTKTNRSAGNTSVRSNKRPSPSSGKESGDNSAEETSPVEIKRPTKLRPTTVQSVRGQPGKTFDEVISLNQLTKNQLMREIEKRQTKERRVIERHYGYLGKSNLIKELNFLLSKENRNAMEKRAENAQRAAAMTAEKKKRRSLSDFRRAMAEKKKKDAMTTAAVAGALAGASVKTAEASMNSKLRNVIQESQLTLKKATNAEKAKTAEVIAKVKEKEKELQQYKEQMTALVTQTQKAYEKEYKKLKKGGENLSAAMVKQIANKEKQLDLMKAKTNKKLALMEAEKNKQIALAATKIEVLAAKYDNKFSKKNILDFISKSVKSNNRLTKKDILEFISKQKTPTVTVKQSIGNVKAEGGKSNVRIVNSKKINREELLAQNIKRRDANYRRIVTTDPMALKRQKRVFAKKRGELLKSIQKIIKSDRKTSSKIKKKVYDSYAKSPRDRISKLLKLPKKDLITMIKRSASRISK